MRVIGRWVIVSAAHWPIPTEFAPQEFISTAKIVAFENPRITHDPHAHKRGLFSHTKTTVLRRQSQVIGYIDQVKIGGDSFGPGGFRSR
ncbi:MAG: hypothetical protein CMJ50_06635 [Planctomycetaceae bacterium]|nr:hypothetical protein [Planctomycetaceae bacterium]